MPPRAPRQRGLVRYFDDKIALMAVALLLTKVGPVLAAVNEQVQRPPAANSETR